MSTHKHIHRHMYKYISTNILTRLPICQAVPVVPVVIISRGLSHPYSCLREGNISFWSSDMVLASTEKSGKWSHWVYPIFSGGSQNWDNFRHFAQISNNFFGSCHIYRQHWLYHFIPLLVTFIFAGCYKISTKQNGITFDTARKFQTISSVAAIFIDNIDFYHFIPLLVTFIFAGCYKISTKQNGITFDTARKFQTISSVAAIFIDNIDFYHFISLLVTFIFAGCYKISTKQNGITFDTARKFQTISLIAATFIDNIDFYHFISLLATFIFAGCYKISTKQNPLASFSRTLVIWSGWNFIQ